MVSITTLRDRVVDTSCILSAGDHPWIRHDSVVFYMKAMEWQLAGPQGFTELQAKGVIQVEAGFAPEVLKRIREGALRSEFLKARFRSKIAAAL